METARSEKIKLRSAGILQPHFRQLGDAGEERKVEDKISAATPSTLLHNEVNYWVKDSPMKIYWEQLSPGERDVLLRHFLLKRRDVPVTAEGVCAALRKTHSLSCHSSKEGKLVFQFVTTQRGARTGASLSDEFAEGIYKAALRAKGLQVEDGIPASFAHRQSTSHRLVRAR